jgi:hypothetical protein
MVLSDGCRGRGQLAAVAATVDAPVHYDGDGFTVTALPLVDRWAWSFQRGFAVHWPPRGHTTRLGRDGLTAAWKPRADGTGRLVSRRRGESSGTWQTTGRPAWAPAAVLIPPGT